MTFKKNFLNATGIDISKPNIRSMKDLAYKNLHEVNVGNFEIDETFVSIVAGEVVEHLSNPALFFQPKKNLNPDKRLI